MGEVITITGKIPDDFPPSFRTPEVIEKAKEVVRRRLALRPQDEVVINIQG